MSQPGTAIVVPKHKAQKPGTAGNAKGQNMAKKSSKTSTVSAVRRPSKLAVNSTSKLSPRAQQAPGGNTGGSKTNVSTKTPKKPVAKPYEPIKLPEDILTIQAHSVSTPVTELPYLLIAAHIGSLPTTRQFYPQTSANPTPLTVFRDMFVMTVDVRGYKPSSIRLSTEGPLIIIEGLQSDVPQVVFTQTGTIDSSDKYVMDPTPTLSSMPVHTTFNYVQHRVKLPDDFSEDGLRVGLDDVSGHVVITGRLVHDQKFSFPEPWNKTKVTKKGRRPLINTANLSREDARKLAAFHAVQGSDDEQNSQEIANTTLLGFGKKQWLEREGAKLRSIQHKALKENIKRLTEMKKSMSAKSSWTTIANKSKSTLEGENKGAAQTEDPPLKHGQQQQRPQTTDPGKTPKRSRVPLQQQEEVAGPQTHTQPPQPESPIVVITKSKSKPPATPQGNLNRVVKVKLSRLMNGPEQAKMPKRKSTVKLSSSTGKVVLAMRKQSIAKLEANVTTKKQSKVITEGRSKGSKVSFRNPASAVADEVDDAAERVSSNDVLQESNPLPINSASKNTKLNEEDLSQAAASGTAGEIENEGKVPSSKKSSKPVSRRGSIVVQEVTPKSNVSIPSVTTSSKNKSKDSLGTASVPKKSKSKQGSSRTQSVIMAEQSVASSSGTETKSGADENPEDDPIGKQDKAMWEKLLNYAGVHRKTRHGK